MKKQQKHPCIGGIKVECEQVRFDTLHELV